MNQYFLGCHPSYFPEPFTQEELEWAADFMRLTRERLSTILPDTEYVFVREPGRFIGPACPIVDNREPKLLDSRPRIDDMTRQRREEVIANRKKLVDQDFESVSRRMLKVIKERRQKQKAPGSPGA